jgi:hypothetical protein
LNLTSRKLFAAIAGLLAVVVSFGFVAFATIPPLTGEFDKVLLAITTITMAAIGAQAVIDAKNGNGKPPADGSFKS